MAKYKLKISYFFHNHRFNPNDIIYLDGKDSWWLDRIDTGRLLTDFTNSFMATNPDIFEKVDEVEKEQEIEKIEEIKEDLGDYKCNYLRNILNRVIDLVNKHDKEIKELKRYSHVDMTDSMREQFKALRT
jgi:hypothetical protein